MIARTRHDECLAHEDCGRSRWPSPRSTPPVMAHANAQPTSSPRMREDAWTPSLPLQWTGTDKMDLASHTNAHTNLTKPNKRDGCPLNAMPNKRIQITP